MTSHALLALALLAATSGSAPAPTADELVAKNLEARGGAAKLHGITALHTVGKVRLGGATEAKTESWSVPPDKYRSEFSLQGMTAVQAWDGQQGWAISPFQGRREPQKLSADDAKDLSQAADAAGPFTDWKAKGLKIEAQGTEDIDGTDAYKIRVGYPNGDSRVVYLDPDSYLEIRVVDHRMIRGQEEVQTTDLGEYEKVDGIYFPMEIGRNQIEKVDLNGTVDPKMFSFPAPAAH